MGFNSVDVDTLYESIADVIKNVNNFSEIIPYLDQNVIEGLIDKYEKYELSSINLTKLLMYCNNNELKKEMLDNRKKYDFSIGSVAAIISSMSLDDLKKDIIDKNIYNLDNYFIDMIISEETSFQYKEDKLLFYHGDSSHESGIIKIIKSMTDKQKKQILNNYEKYNLNNRVVFEVLFSLEPSYTKEKIKSIYEKKFLTVHTPKKVNLDYTLPFGIEIEFLGYGTRDIDQKYFGDNWNAHSDASLNGFGYELSSPVMRSKLGYEDEIYKACYALSERGWYVNESCAGHVHLGIEYFAGEVEPLKVFVNLYRNVERILYIISNKENDLPRGAIVIHAATLKNMLDKKEKTNELDLSNVKTIIDFRDEIKKAQEVKWYGINFLNIGTLNKNTIEFRMANGTLDGDIWIENINLFGGMMQASKKIADLIKKDFNDLTIDDLSVLKKYISLINGDLNEEERLNLFLDLAVSKDDKVIYIKRYYANNVLEEDSEIENFLDDTGKPKKPIRIREY